MSRVDPTLAISSFVGEDIESALQIVPNLLQQVPELEQIFDAEGARRLLANAGLALIAQVNGEPAGFKLGYDRFSDGSYYSWLGGVVPEHRGGLVAQHLLTYQETWVRDQGYRGIYVKTRNGFVGMRILLARNGYDMVGIEPYPDAMDSRLLHYKSLLS